MTDGRLQHQGDQPIVVEVVTDHDDRRGDLAEPVGRRFARTPIDNKQRDFAGFRRQRRVVLHFYICGRERRFHDPADGLVAANADRTRPHQRSSVARRPTSVNSKETRVLALLSHTRYDRTFNGGSTDPTANDQAAAAPGARADRVAREDRSSAHAVRSRRDL
ncbi:MAG TPA: hypothetical protein VFS15_04370 [Kofleriaceae bacterium]|nr:hypothetical protein [Kofleriaceae bacterium]